MKKKITFHTSFEDQRLYSQQHSLEMSDSERLREMQRLNKKLFGENYGKISKKTELYVAKPGEGVNEFYKRINNG